MIKFFKKKPVVIEAVQYTGNNEDEILKWCTDSFRFYDHDVMLYIKTLEGNMLVSQGDYVIKGVKGEFYPCKEDIFNLTYDLMPS